MLNIVALEGRLTADPEMRHTQNDIAVTSFSIAVQRGRKNADGEYESDFFTIVAWRGTAELAAKYFKKGQLCVVEGILQQRHYTDRDGNKRQTIEVVARSIHFAGGKSDDTGSHPHANGGGSTSSSASSAPKQSSNAPAASAGSNDDFIELLGDDTLPF